MATKKINYNEISLEELQKLALAGDASALAEFAKRSISTAKAEEDAKRAEAEAYREELMAFKPTNIRRYDRDTFEIVFPLTGKIRFNDFARWALVHHFAEFAKLNSIDISANTEVNEKLAIIANFSK